MHIFLTGGSGFVGRGLIRWSIEHGDTVTALARSDKSAQAVKDAAGPKGSSRVRVARGDLSDVSVLAQGMD